MEKNPDLGLSEVVFGTADKKVSAQISKLHKRGVLRKIAPRIYSPNLIDKAEDIIRRNLFIVLGHQYPGAIVSHRSAFEFQPTEAGHIFLTYKYTKKVRLPGVTLRLLQGPERLEGDRPFTGNLYASQRARAFLENLQVSKSFGPRSKSLSKNEIEDKLEQIVRVNGEDGLNKVRDTARELSLPLSMEKEFAILDAMISSILSTHDAGILSSPLATTRAFGFPYDPLRLQLFEVLFRALHAEESPSRPDQNSTEESFKNFAFFESYFSNYIEGTVFEVDEARQIIETNKPMPTRNEDSHDVMGTYQIVASKKEMGKTPQSADELLLILRYRHRILLSARPEKTPGLFKDRNNFAGQTAFVDFNLVNGTLIKAFDFYQTLEHPFAKAAYMMFMISEVHPFSDGNGRVARVMMNAELVAGGQSKIIIPTVFRDDYLGALRKLTRQQAPEPYIRMLLRAYAFSASIYSEQMDDMQQQLVACNAFMEHTEGKLRIVERG